MLYKICSTVSKGCNNMHMRILKQEIEKRTLVDLHGGMTMTSAAPITKSNQLKNGGNFTPLSIQQFVFVVNEMSIGIAPQLTHVKLHSPLTNLLV